MKPLVAAITFLTRLPIPGDWNIDAATLGRSTAFFPLIGAGIGAVQCGFLSAILAIFHYLGQRFEHSYALPTPLLAVVIVIIGVLTTGALHLDGLADMADGFGGGRSRDDVLRIMRDHAIGAYGSLAVTLLLALKIVSVFPMIDHGIACRYLVVAPALARGSVAVLSFALPYARAEDGGLGGISQHVRIVEVLLSGFTTVALALWLGVWRGGTILVVTIIASLWNAHLCRKRIQGVTGDTLGANVEVCETLILAAGAILTS